MQSIAYQAIDDDLDQVSQNLAGKWLGTVEHTCKAVIIPLPSSQSFFMSSPGLTGKYLNIKICLKRAAWHFYDNSITLVRTNSFSFN